MSIFMALNLVSIESDCLDLLKVIYIWWCTHNGHLDYYLADSAKSYVQHFSSRSWSNIYENRCSSVPRVTYRRLEKIASYHYLPRVVYNGSLKKSQSHQSFSSAPSSVKDHRKRSTTSSGSAHAADASSNTDKNFLPLNEFGSLDSLTSVTTFSYIACRDQREREEDVYEVKPNWMGCYLI